MGYLAAYLQQEFSRRCPAGWHARHEVNVLSAELGRLLGYSPRVDVLLERDDGSQRLWLEFEISRADPVANHAKFATAHLFQPQGQGDAFISMITPRVRSGRRNLAANTVLVMRHLGMNAFQTVLLPTHSGSAVKRLNYLPLDKLQLEPIDVDAEVTRALTVTQPVLEGYDPRFRRFAPSKYCAYVPITPAYPASAAEYMTVEFYTSIERSNRIFDGTRARQHLTDNLTMRLVTPDKQPQLLTRFEKWLASYRDVINVHPAGPQFIVPPKWF